MDSLITLGYEGDVEVPCDARARCRERVSEFAREGTGRPGVNRPEVSAALELSGGPFFGPGSELRLDYFSLLFAGFDFTKRPCVSRSISPSSMRRARSRTASRISSFLWSFPFRTTLTFLRFSS